jgi:hypothetical protein
MHTHPRAPSPPFLRDYNRRIVDKLLDCEIFYSLKEAQTAIEAWRQHYNTIRLLAPQQPSKA